MRHQTANHKIRHRHYASETSSIMMHSFSAVLLLFFLRPPPGSFFVVIGNFASIDLRMKKNSKNQNQEE
jgi:hypothetical protein